LIEPSRHRAIGGLIRNATASDELTLNSDKVVQNVHLGGLPFKQAGAQHSQSPIIAEAGAVIVVTVDPVGHGKRFNSERTLHHITAPVSGEITGAIISSDAVAGRIWHPMTKPPARNTFQSNATFVRLKCMPVLGYCNFQLQCSATKHYSAWGRCAFRPAGKGTRCQTARKRTNNGGQPRGTAEAVTINQGAGLRSRAHTAGEGLKPSALTRRVFLLALAGSESCCC
jgi:hypothetical protein